MQMRPLSEVCAHARRSRGARSCVGLARILTGLFLAPSFISLCLRKYTMPDITPLINFAPHVWSVGRGVA